MIKIEKFVMGNLATNCYMLWDEKTKDAVIIDPAESYRFILDFAKKNNLILQACLLTHGHYDHIGACYELQQHGIPIYIHELDAPKCQDNDLNLSNQFAPDKNIKTFKPNYMLSEDTNFLQFGGIELVALHTPGHSEGSCSYIFCFYDNGDLKQKYEKHLFSGDAIFENGGFGRYDFYDGSRDKTVKTVKMLRKFVDEGYILHAGH